jgi:hypothetical protein
MLEARMSDDDDFHLCPVCKRENRRGEGPLCDHYLGYLYDHEFFDDTRAREYESLWGTLENAYQDLDLAVMLVEKLHSAGLDEIATALKNDDKFWWLEGLEQVIDIYAQASLASGTGSLSHGAHGTDRDWYDEILGKLRRANQIYRKALS